MQSGNKARFLVQGIGSLVSSSWNKTISWDSGINKSTFPRDPVVRNPVNHSKMLIQGFNEAITKNKGFYIFTSLFLFLC